MSRLFREQRNDVIIAHPARTHDICFAQRRHGSAPILALGRASPEQVECGAVVAGLEQVGADRLGEGGIVDLQRDIFAGLLSSATPARADLRSILVASVNPIVWRVLGIGVLGRNKCELDVEGERAQAPGEAMLGAGEGADLCHVVVLSVGGGEVVGKPANG